MDRQAQKVNSTGQQCRVVLMAIVLLAAHAVFAQPAQRTKVDVTEEGATGNRIVVVHTGDAVGTSGLAAVKSCVRKNVPLSDEKAMDGLRSVLLVMKYNETGRIVGVHYGEKDVCDFLQQTPGVTAS